jgi:hypothetical protein
LGDYRVPEAALNARQSPSAKMKKAGPEPRPFLSNPISP